MVVRTGLCNRECDLLMATAALLRKEGYSIALRFRNAFLKDSSPVNRSISGSVGPSRIFPYKWLIRIGYGLEDDS